MPITATYQFSIINFNNKKSPRDPKVRETIIAIIENFFMESQEVMLYICETGDGKQSMRSRLFEYWFNHYKKHWNIMFLKEYRRGIGFWFGWAGYVLLAIGSVWMMIRKTSMKKASER